MTVPEEAVRLWRAASDRILDDAELHARVQTTLKVMQAMGGVAAHPSDAQERTVHEAVVRAAAIACITHVGDRKIVAVITPNQHYFRKWQETHPEFEGVCVTDAYGARGAIFDTYVTYDPHAAMSPARLGETVAVVRERIRR